jgi:peptide/nickel transport system permease protein
VNARAPAPATLPADPPPAGTGRHEAIYGALLALYPWRFRREYAREMRLLFRDRLRRELHSGGSARLAWFWGLILADLIRSATKERVAAVTRLDWRERAVTSRSFGVGRYVLRRVLLSIPVLIGASVVVFLVVHATSNPLSTLAGNPRISAADRQRLTVQLGLDHSGLQQYLAWLSHFIRGDWGHSLVTQAPVSSDIREALANSVVLGAVGIAFSLIVGVTIGVISALREYSVFDSVSTGSAFFGLSVPTFWFALMLQAFFGLYLTRWLHLSTPILYTAGIATPGTVGFHLVDRIRHLALPALVLSVQIIAVFSRYMRASMLEVIHSDYLRTARAKGIRERRVIVRHAVRNALIPLTTQVALEVGAIAGGLIITEQIFQWPGMGKFFVTAIANGDYTQVLPWLMITVGFVVLFNLVADIAYAFLDPRIRYA